MNLRAAFAFVVGSLVAVVAVGAGCGNSVAGCGDACPSGTNACSTECSSLQMECAASEDGADFQALLTCVTNSGNYLSPLPTDCVAEYNTVKTNCTGTAPVDGH